MTALCHLTLNTGHLARTPRSEVPQAVVDRLLPLVDAGGGPIPGLDGWHLDLMFPLDDRGARMDGAAYFQVAPEPGTSRRPVVMAVACWRPELAASAWTQAVAGYTAMRSSLIASSLWLEPPDSPPASLPWIAAWLTPFIALADAETMAFGDLERCLVWALADAHA